MTFSVEKLNFNEHRYGIELEFAVPMGEFESRVDIVDGWELKEEHCGCELASPPLKGYIGLAQVYKQSRKINEAFDKVPIKDCGFHVHVDISKYLMGDAKRLLQFASRFDDVIFSFMGSSRQENKHCNHLFYTEEEIRKCKTLADIQELQTNGRHSAVNFYSYPKYKTVEFRYARSTVNWKSIYALTQLYVRLVAFAKMQWPIPIWNHGEIKEGQNLLFDSLQVPANVRDILTTLGENNGSMNKDSLTESFEEIINDFQTAIGVI